MGRTRGSIVGLVVLPEGTKSQVSRRSEPRLWTVEKGTAEEGRGRPNRSGDWSRSGGYPRRVPPPNTHTSVFPGRGWGSGGLKSKLGKERGDVTLWYAAGCSTDVGRGGSSSSRCGQIQEPGLSTPPARPPRVSDLGLVFEFGGRGGEEAAGTEEGRPQSPGVSLCPRPKVCGGF